MIKPGVLRKGTPEREKLEKTQEALAKRLGAKPPKPDQKRQDEAVVNDKQKPR